MAWGFCLGTSQPIFPNSYGVLRWLVSALKALSLPAFRLLRPGLLSVPSEFARSNTVAIDSLLAGDRVRLFTRRGYNWADR